MNTELMFIVAAILFCFLTLLLINIWKRVRKKDIQKNLAEPAAPNHPREGRLVAPVATNHLREGELVAPNSSQLYADILHADFATTTGSISTTSLIRIGDEPWHRQAFNPVEVKTQKVKKSIKVVRNTERPVRMIDNDNSGSI